MKAGLLKCVSVTGALMALLATRGDAAQLAGKDLAVMVKSQLKLSLCEQAADNAKGMAAKAAAKADGSEVEKAVDVWWEQSVLAIRSDLEKQFGEEARGKFDKYMVDQAAAEKKGDKEFLALAAQSLAIEPVPADFVALRKQALEMALKDDMQAASKWLGDIETWLDLRKQGKEVPPLGIWLTRAIKSSAMTKTPPAKKVDPLQSAEVEVEEFKPEKDGGDSPLDNFSAQRNQRREKAMKEAQAGMAQVAAERQAAETEYAAKKAAEATAEADAMKSNADKIAAAEKEALEQRQNSWGARLKTIVGSLVSATTGAFTGGLGAKAGEEAVNAVFGKTK